VALISLACAAHLQISVSEDQAGEEAEYYIEEKTEAHSMCKERKACRIQVLFIFDHIRP
jgi:hypothetical protein